MVAVAHANDGGGSIRIPASCCGLVGLKPSRGRTSLMPDYSVVDDLLVVELCVSRTRARHRRRARRGARRARSATPCARRAPARPYRDEVGAEPGKLRIGLLTHNPLDTGEIHPDCVAAARDAAQLLESLGHTVEETFPTALADPALVGHFTTLWAGDARRTTSRYWERKVGRADHRGRRRTAHVDARGDGPGDHRARLRRRAARARRARTRASRSGTRRATTCCSRRRSASRRCALGTFSTPDEPILGFIRAGDVRAVHAAREHDRAARDLAAAALERRRPADRRRS